MINEENLRKDSIRLIVDLGNTLSKFGVFKEGQFVRVKTFNELKKTEISVFFAEFPSIEACIVSSVISCPEWLISKLEKESRVHLFSHSSSLPLKNCYKSPTTLGLDRLACAVGAYHAFQGFNVLSIDAGTCIKYDFVNTKGEYLGGAISPGINMRLKAMNAFTARLPLADAEGELYLTGRTTDESLRTGAVLGSVAEADAMIAYYNEKYNDLRVLLTGGDAKYFDNQLKNRIFARPNLLMEGLHEILIFNEI